MTITTNAAQFRVDVSRWSTSSLPRAFKRHRDKVAKALLRGSVQLTPVDQGDARAGWRVTINRPAPPRATRRRRRGGPDLRRAAGRGAINTDVIGKGNAVIDRARPFSEIYISNIEPHAPVLEFGLFVPPNPGPSKDPRPGRRGRILVRGGFSVQGSGKGMYGVTASKVARMFGGG